jgi:hypothetical protein
MDPLVTSLRRVRRRLAVQQWVRFSIKVLILASTASCIWLVITRFFPALGDPVQVCLGLLAVGIIVASFFALLRRPSLLKAALEADKRLRLHERLTSSFELAEVEGPMIEAVHLDARRHLAHLDIRKSFPYRPPRSGRWLAIPLIVFGLAYLLLPEFDLTRYRERKAEAKAREEATRVKVEKLKSAVRPLRKPTQEPASELADVATAVERVAESLESQEITEKQALARLADLTEELLKHREKLQTDSPMPKLAADTNKLGISREIASDVQSGRFGDAAQKTRELQEKLKEGALTEKEMEKLADDLKKLSEMLGGESSELGKALAEALGNTGKSLKSRDVKGALEAMEGIELSLEDLASVLEQLGQLDLMMVNLADWQQDLLGPSNFCRNCGAMLKPCTGEGGQCTGCGAGHSCYGSCGTCSGTGPGMGGTGMGRGNRVGELPDLNAGFKPTVLPGDLTKGKVLATILQKGAPQDDAESTLEYVTEAFVEVRQEAEQALTKEEIPPGAKEFVRQYFGSLEPEQSTVQGDPSGSE